VSIETPAFGPLKLKSLFRTFAVSVAPINESGSPGRLPATEKEREFGYSL
jgi:hypothetical protein